jgi:hypothetical protein
MPTQKEVQHLFNQLVTSLKTAAYDHLKYTVHDVSKHHRRPPLDQFLALTTNPSVTEAFLRQIYAHAFHTGRIPRGRNHIAIQCGLQVNTGTTSTLKLWLDLDKVATLLNSEFGSSYYFTLNPKSGQIQETIYHSSGDRVNLKISHAINSHHHFIMNAHFLGYLSAAVSGCALLIVSLALVSLMSISTAGLCTIMGLSLGLGLSLASGITSYCFFNKTDHNRINTQVANLNEATPDSIETVFKKHFAPIISKYHLNESPVSLLTTESEALVLS